MTKKKTLLKEGTVRQFMKLANLRPLASDFVEKLYEGDNTDLDDSIGAKKKNAKDSEQTEKDKRDESEADEKKAGKPKFSGNKSSEQTNEMVEVDLGEELEGEVEIEDEMEIEEPVGELEGEDEVSITPEEADVLIGLADKLAAAKGEESVEGFDDELDAEEEVEDLEDLEEDSGDEERDRDRRNARDDQEHIKDLEDDERYEKDHEHLQEMVNSIAENVTKRIAALASKKRKK